MAQNPLPSTVRNFWKVIYDRKCAAVVMLTPLRENGEVRAGLTRLESPLEECGWSVPAGGVLPVLARDWRGDHIRRVHH